MKNSLASTLPCLGLVLASVLSFGLNAAPAKSQSVPDYPGVATTLFDNSNCLTNLRLPGNHPASLKQKRVELFYYRDAATIAALINSLPLHGQGCAGILPLRQVAAHAGVGAGGGNIVLLSGDNTFIRDAYRLIASLDLPLAGVELQLWGIQISSNHPERFD